MIPTPFRSAAAMLGFAALVACAPADPDAPLPDLGDFRLGHNVVLAREVQKGPFSREAAPDELTAALAQAIEDRLAGYDGDGLYHFGISIGGYVLAQPGLPVVYTPRSVMIFEVTVYDNLTGEKLNPEPHRITAFEGFENTAPLVGSGLARNREEQLRNLVREGARLLQEWLIENREWFTPDPEKVRVEFDRDEQRAKLEEALR